MDEFSRNSLANQKKKIYAISALDLYIYIFRAAHSVAPHSSEAPRNMQQPHYIRWFFCVNWLGLRLRLLILAMLRQPPFRTIYICMFGYTTTEICATIIPCLLEFAYGGAVIIICLELYTSCAVATRKYSIVLYIVHRDWRNIVDEQAPHTIARNASGSIKCIVEPTARGFPICMCVCVRKSPNTTCGLPLFPFSCVSRISYSAIVNFT